MKVLVIFVMWCGVAIGQVFGPPLAMLPPTTTGTPGLATFLQVGKLSCAARMWSVALLQVWCLKGGVVVINIAKSVEPGGYIFDYDDSINDPMVARINWTFFMDYNPVPWNATITVGTTVGGVLGGTLNVPL